jgi:hypothetical protein
MPQCLTDRFSLLTVKGALERYINRRAGIPLIASGVTSKPASWGHLKTGQLSASRTPCFYPTFDRFGKVYSYFCI